MDNQKSFYDLDYIIELSEKRLDQYTSAYQSVLGRLANIILIYTAIGIYLIPIVQDFDEINSYAFKSGTLLMLSLITISIIFTIRLMWPVYISYLEISKHYYETLRMQYEKRDILPEMASDKIVVARENINRLLKTSYIDELNRAQQNNRNVFVTKSAHYYRALLFGLMAVIPYVLCVDYHINKKEEKVQKIEIIKTKNVVTCLPVK